MIGHDKELYRKMVGIWSITAIPRLQATFANDKVQFNCTGGEIVSMNSQLFFSLAPIEVVKILEQKFEKIFNVDAKIYRKSLSAFNKDPFASQN